MMMAESKAQAEPPPLSLLSTIRLNDKKTDMPVFGMGLSHNQGGFSRPAVLAALDAGIPLFDTAKRYGTEASLAEAIAASDRPRDQLFLTTKLWPGDADVGAAKEACAASLARLDGGGGGGDRPIDLYLQHWPGQWHGGSMDESRAAAKERRQATWRQMELCVESGLARAIGVSNFLVPHLEDVLDGCSIPPAVNQIECNPYQQQDELARFCAARGIVVEGYCPLGKGRVLSDPRLGDLAKAVTERLSGSRAGAAAAAPVPEVTPAQVLLRWSMQKGAVTIPKSTNPDHIRSNLRCFDFELAPSEMAMLDTFEMDLRCTWDSRGVV